MLSSLKLLLVATVGAAVLCPLCESRVVSAAAPETAAGTALARADTSTARLHISGMTCGTCPTTARIALRRVTGVYDAKVTLDDSLGVVHYDPARVTAKTIAEQLTRLTGYHTTILGDSVASRARAARS